MTGRVVTRKGPENVSLHSRILNDIQRKILSGEWEPGRRIPVEHELVEQYGCSRMTVSKVLTQLAQAGIIERRRKAGSFVSHPHSQSAVLSIPDIKAEVGALGQPYSFQLLQRVRRRSTREDRALLATQVNIPVLEMSCQHLAGEQPFCFEYRLINVQAVPEVVDQDFNSQAPGAWLLSQVPWTQADHRIRSAGATEEVADILKIKPRTPCLIVERLTRDTERTVTFVRLTYPGTMHELVASFTPLGARSSSPSAA